MSPGVVPEPGITEHSALLLPVAWGAISLLGAALLGAAGIIIKLLRRSVLTPDACTSCPAAQRLAEGDRSFSHLSEGQRVIALCMRDLCHGLNAVLDCPIDCTKLDKWITASGGTPHQAGGSQ